MILKHSDRIRELGGPGSGNFGHAGIPGQRGGSQKGSGGIAKPSKQSFNNMRDIQRESNNQIFDENDPDSDIYERAEESKQIMNYIEQKYHSDGIGSDTMEKHLVETPNGVGYMYYDQHLDGEGYVMIQGIASFDVRKPGTGVRVINYAKKLARQKGVKQIELEYTRVSAPYYRKKGFELDGKYARLKV